MRCHKPLKSISFTSTTSHTFKHFCCCCCCIQFARIRNRKPTMLRSEAWLRDRSQGRLLVPPLDVSLASSSRFSRRETGGTFAWLKSLYLSCPRFWYENNIPPSAFTKGACQVRPMFTTDTLSRRPVARAEKGESGFDPLREPGRRVHGPTGRLHRPRPVPQRAGHLRRLPADRREEHRALED